LSGVELRALRRQHERRWRLLVAFEPSERGAPFTTAGWRKMVVRLGVLGNISDLRRDALSLSYYHSPRVFHQSP
jgi:hypothetical protein